MKPRRLSIAGLLGAVAVAGIGLAALRAATEVWAAATYSATLLMLGISLTGAFAGRGRRRAAWSGAVIMGGGYLLLIYSPWSESDSDRLASYPYEPGGFRSITVTEQSTMEGNLGPAFLAQAPQVDVRFGPVFTDRLLYALYLVANRSRVHQPGDRIRVLWNKSYYPSRVLDRREGQYLIHYDDHAEGSNNWVSPESMDERFRSFEHFRRTGHSMTAILLGALGAALGLAFRGREPPPPASDVG